MILRSRPAHFLALLLSFACLPAMSDEFRQRGAHQHGQGMLGIAADGGTMVVEFTAPAVNVVGFEHEPRSKADREAVDQARSLLQRGQGLFGLPAAAMCKFVKVTVTIPEWEEGEDEHDGHHEEEHGDEHDEGHASYSARWEYQCSQPQALSFIEPWIFAKLKHMQRLDASVITASTQRQQAVTDSKQRIWVH